MPNFILRTVFISPPYMLMTEKAFHLLQIFRFFFIGEISARHQVSLGLKQRSAEPAQERRKD